MWVCVFYSLKLCIGLVLTLRSSGGVVGGVVSNRFALYTATSLASKYAGLENITGSIDVGKDADMIVVSENPLDDLKALRYVEKVFTRGKLIDHPKVKINKTVETELDKYL